MNASKYIRERMEVLLDNLQMELKFFSVSPSAGVENEARNIVSTAANIKAIRKALDELEAVLKIVEGKEVA